jgi:hypothetical protein
MASRCPVLTNHMATLTGNIVLHVVLYMDLYVFDTYPYTLKSHIPQKEDKGGLTNTKICIFKAKYTAGDFVR